MKRVPVQWDYEETEDTRIPAWHPILGWVQHAAHAWSTPLFRGNSLVDEGCEKVWEMALSYYYREQDVDFLHRVGTKLNAYGLVNVSEYGDSPGGSPYLYFHSFQMIEGDYITVMFDEESSDVSPVISGGVTWIGGEQIGNNMDFVNLDYMTVPAVMAAVLHLANKHRAEWVNDNA